MIEPTEVESREALRHLLRAVIGLSRIIVRHDQALNQCDANYKLGEAIDEELIAAEADAQH